MSRVAKYDLDTPAVVVDLAVLDANIDRMARAMAARGVVLRPHAKTHKSVAVARRQLEAGAVGLTVATLSEAEVFANAGCDDVFVAYPVFPSGTKGERLRRLHERVHLRVGLDSRAAAYALGAALAGTSAPLDVVIEVDCGQHRSGVGIDKVVPLAEAAVAAGLRVVGCFTHAGHAYAAPDGPAGAAVQENAALTEAAGLLDGAGFDVLVVSAGSTPTALHSAHGRVNEERPGTYVFGDAQQLVLGTCGLGEVALRVVATVVSASEGRYVLDAGSKALSADRPAWMPGFGLVPDRPDDRVATVTEEHAVVEAGGGPLPMVGRRIEVVPNHVCPVVNLADELVLVEGEEVVDRWPIDARGHRSPVAVS